MAQGWLMQSNIERFRQLLLEETDQDKRRVLEMLLRQERAKLTDLQRGEDRR